MHPRIAPALKRMMSNMGGDAADHFDMDDPSTKAMAEAMMAGSLCLVYPSLFGSLLGHTLDNDPQHSETKCYDKH